MGASYIPGRIILASAALAASRHIFVMFTFYLDLLPKGEKNLS